MPDAMPTPTQDEPLPPWRPLLRGALERQGRSSPQARWLQLASLAALHERAWMRPPTRRELEGLMDGWIREEVAEREARDRLRRLMEAEGFAVYDNEWWHFDYQDWRSYRIGNQTFEELTRR